MSPLLEKSFNPNETIRGGVDPKVAPLAEKVWEDDRNENIRWAQEEAKKNGAKLPEGSTIRIFEESRGMDQLQAINVNAPKMVRLRELARQQDEIDREKAENILRTIERHSDSRYSNAENIAPESGSRSSRFGEARISQSATSETPSIPASLEAPKKNGFFSSFGARLRGLFGGGKKEVSSFPAIEASVFPIAEKVKRENKSVLSELVLETRGYGEQQQGEGQERNGSKEIGSVEEGQVSEEQLKEIESIARSRSKIREYVKRFDFASNLGHLPKKEFMQECILQDNANALFEAMLSDENKKGKDAKEERAVSDEKEKSPHFLKFARNVEFMKELIPDICFKGSEMSFARFVSGFNNDDVKEDFATRILQEVKRDKLPGLQPTIAAFRIKDDAALRRVVVKYAEMYPTGSTEPISDPKENVRFVERTIQRIREIEKKESNGA